MLRRQLHLITETKYFSLVCNGMAAHWNWNKNTATSQPPLNLNSLQPSLPQLKNGLKIRPLVLNINLRQARIHWNWNKNTATTQPPLNLNSQQSSFPWSKNGFKIRPLVLISFKAGQDPSDQIELSNTIYGLSITLLVQSSKTLTMISSKPICCQPLDVKQQKSALQ